MERYKAGTERLMCRKLQWKISKNPNFFFLTFFSFKILISFFLSFFNVLSISINIEQLAWHYKTKIIFIKHGEKKRKKISLDPYGEFPHPGSVWIIIRIRSPITGLNWRKLTTQVGGVGVCQHSTVSHCVLQCCGAATSRVEPEPRAASSFWQAKRKALFLWQTWLNSNV